MRMGLAPVNQSITPDADVQAEATRLVQRAAEAGVVARLVGGTAVGLHRHGPPQPALDRPYGDIDLVVKRGHDRPFRHLLDEVGYVPHRGFNNLHGDRRLLYFDEANHRQLDVFIGSFRMCHVLELNDRLHLDPATLTPSDLLLTKLQIIQLNRKDIIDAMALLLTHDFGNERQGDVLDLQRLGEVTSKDWGWHTTFSDNLARLTAATDMGLSPDAQGAVADRVTAIQKALNGAPKSLGWRTRAAVGRRVLWYDLPEEIAHG